MANTLHTKLETAAKAVVDSLAISGLNVYMGLNNEEKVAPCAVVHALPANEDFVGGGIWHVPLDVMVVHMAADDTGENDTVANSVFEKFCSSDIATNLQSGVSGLAVLDVFVGGMDSTIEQDAYTRLLSLEVIAALTN